MRRDLCFSSASRKFPWMIGFCVAALLAAAAPCMHAGEQSSPANAESVRGCSDCNDTNQSQIAAKQREVDEHEQRSLLALGLYQLQGRLAEAEKLLGMLIARREQAFGADHPSANRLRLWLAGLVQQGGRHAEAVAIYEQLQKVLERDLGPAHLDVAKVLSALAGAYQALGRDADAEGTYKKSLDVLEASPTDPWFLDTKRTVLAGLARLYRKQERAADAVSIEQQLTAIAPKPDEDPPYAKIRRGKDHQHLAARPSSFAARSQDNPHALWPGLDALVSEIHQDGKVSIFGISEKSGLQGPGAIYRFFDYVVAYLARQRGYRYFVQSEPADNQMLVVFLKTRDEEFRTIVRERYRNFRISIQVPDEFLLFDVAKDNAFWGQSLRPSTSQQPNT